ncbi:16S rRNA (cytidine(1402)-2'-O)-methyltransferase [Bdellovibrio bacteriovorus]|uniref:16S rRNA (cytidine(1402)-2'-O)-methyltransferase n=1 Tax=Bdellovibrio bacteriovorus TaxID=959 RepID=UPI0021D107CB|nr:16S rRNA (cytidine(1402)-2'-O)-methyltransferase [Bdellovibrio bacteriovorus]UXR64516.1 16S rRNA (cytidine(1402)-2'-O)-methyltransferase [Bdellovibrio bacteriovorus]
MLYVVATPIGDVSEISLRALEILKNCDVVICESTKEASKLLRAHGISGKTYEVLDEHSTPDDKMALVPLCAEKNVALVSDCGTPGFCDPGADLVRLCRQKNVPVKSVLGASALMGLLSLSGQRIDEFVFRGFLPAENEARARALKELTREKRAIIVMDTPYRLKKTLNDMKDHFFQRRFLLTMNLSQEEEVVLEGSIDKLIAGLRADKAEFMLLIYPV